MEQITCRSAGAGCVVEPSLDMSTWPISHRAKLVCHVVLWISLSCRIPLDVKRSRSSSWPRVQFKHNLRDIVCHSTCAAAFNAAVYLKNALYCLRTKMGFHTFRVSRMKTTVGCLKCCGNRSGKASRQNISFVIVCVWAVDKICHRFTASLTLIRHCYSLEGTSWLFRRSGSALVVQGRRLKKERKSVCAGEAKAVIVKQTSKMLQEWLTWQGLVRGGACQPTDFMGTAGNTFIWC